MIIKGSLVHKMIQRSQTHNLPHFKNYENLRCLSSTNKYSKLEIVQYYKETLSQAHWILSFNISSCGYWVAILPEEFHKMLWCADIPSSLSQSSALFLFTQNAWIFYYRQFTKYSLRVEKRIPITKIDARMQILFGGHIILTKKSQVTSVSFQWQPQKYSNNDEYDSYIYVSTFPRILNFCSLNAHQIAISPV